MLKLIVQLSLLTFFCQSCVFIDPDSTWQHNLYLCRLESETVWLNHLLGCIANIPKQVIYNFVIAMFNLVKSLLTWRDHWNSEKSFRMYLPHPLSTLLHAFSDLAAHCASWLYTLLVRWFYCLTRTLRNNSYSAVSLWMVYRTFVNNESDFFTFI